MPNHLPTLGASVCLLLAFQGGERGVGLVFQGSLKREIGGGGGGCLMDVEAPPMSHEQGEASDSWCCTNAAISNERNMKARLMFKGFTLFSTATRATSDKAELLSICGQAYVKLKLRDKVAQGLSKGSTLLDRHRLICRVITLISVQTFHKFSFDTLL